MKVKALRLGQKFVLKDLQVKLRFRPAFKDPLVLEYARAKFIVIFRYGVVVFWGLNAGEINKFLIKISDFVLESFDKPAEEDLSVIAGAKTNGILAAKIHTTDLSVKKVALISMVLGRSMALELFESQVEKVLADFEIVMNSFVKTGRMSFTTRYLLKRVGLAMQIQHGAVNEMAMLDKPDLTWEDSELDLFYNELALEYELEDRYSILNEKLKTLFRNVEFILNLIATNRGLILELTIVILILVEIGLFFYK